MLGCKESTKQKIKKPIIKQIQDSTSVIKNTKKKVVTIKEKTFVEKLDSVFLNKDSDVEIRESVNFTQAINDKRILYTSALLKKRIHIYRERSEVRSVMVYEYNSNESALKAFNEMYKCYIDKCDNFTPKGFATQGEIFLLIKNKVFSPARADCQDSKQFNLMERMVFDNLLEKKEYKGFSIYCGGKSKKWGNNW
jgi:predicted N-acyltransferase